MFGSSGLSWQEGGGRKISGFLGLLVFCTLLKIHFILFVVILMSENNENWKLRICFNHWKCFSHDSSSFSLRPWISVLKFIFTDWFRLAYQQHTTGGNSNVQVMFNWEFIQLRVQTRTLPWTTMAHSLIWAGLTLSFGRPCESTERSPSPSSLAVWQSPLKIYSM